MKLKKGFKKQILVILLMILTIQMSYTQHESELKTTPEIGFKIDLTKQVYSKAEVETIIIIIVEEYSAGIDEAFKEGYKAGLLKAAPDRDYYMSLSLSLEKEVERLNRKSNVPWWSLPVAIISGTALGFGLSYLRK